MAFEKGHDKEKDITFGKDWDSQKMLNLYLHNHMKKKGLHDVADIFSKEVNLEMVELLDSDKGFLKEWWEIVWHQFSSALANKAGGNSQSSVQRCKDDVLAMVVASLQKQEATSSQHTAIGNPQLNVIPTPVTNQHMLASGGSTEVNLMENPPPSLLQTPPIISLRRAGKCPVNTDTESVQWKSSVPYRNPSNLQLPVTMQSPVEVTGDPRNDALAERSDQMESNRLGWNSAYIPPLHGSFSKFLKK